MPRVHTRYFGEVTCTSDAVIEMPLGIPGFSDQCSYVLVQVPDQYPLVYLQSTNSPALCFPALPVRVVDPGYRLELADDEAALLGVKRCPEIGSDVLCLAVIAAHDTCEPTANLMAPVVICIATRVAVQSVNMAAEYPCRQPLGEGVPA